MYSWLSVALSHYTLNLLLAQRQNLKLFYRSCCTNLLYYRFDNRIFLFFPRQGDQLHVFHLHFLLITSTPHALICSLPITIHFLFDLPIIRFQSISHRSRLVHVCYSKTRFTSITLSNLVTSHIHFEFLVLDPFVRISLFAFNTRIPPSIADYSGLLPHRNMLLVSIYRNGTIRTNNDVAAKVVEGPRSTRKRVFYFHKQTRPIDLAQKLTGTSVNSQVVNGHWTV